MKYIALFAIIAVSISNAHKLEKKSSLHHAADYIDENGEEISTSLAVQLKDRINMEHNHACDFIDEKGEEISTSLMPEY